MRLVIEQDGTKLYYNGLDYIINKTKVYSGELVLNSEVAKRKNIEDYSVYDAVLTSYTGSMTIPIPVLIGLKYLEATRIMNLVELTLCKKYTKSV